MYNLIFHLYKLFYLLLFLFFYILINNKNEQYYLFLYYLQDYKNLIYEIIEENDKIYVVLLKDNINLDNINIIKEGYKEYDNK